jgi:hypothetical protein
MKRIALVFASALLFCVPALMAQDYDHVEVGAFADYFNLSRTTPNRNMVGLGGRAAFNVHPNVQLEAEMSYDFKRNFTSTFSNGITTQLVSSRLRTLHALFGPKFNTSAGAFRAFGTFKVGLVSFSVSDQNAPAGFTGALGAVENGDSRFAMYPGVGVEGFWGPFGLRLDVGDDIYFDKGAQNNLKITFGPHFRF